MDFNNLTRSFQFENASIDEENRTVNATISTEYPVVRNGLTEILSHAEGAIDFSCFPIPILRSHDHNALPCGVAENPQLVGKELKTTLRFSKTPEADSTWQDVKDKILRSLSVCYSIAEKAKTASGYLATKWTPAEVSLVSIAADPAALIGRSEVQEKINNTNLESENTNMELEIIKDEADKGFRSAGEFLKAVIGAATPGQVTDSRLLSRAASGANIGTPADGGYLITEQMGDLIQDKIYDPSTVSGKCKRISLTGNANSLKVPVIDDLGRGNVARTAITAAYIDEGGEITASKPAFSAVDFSLKKLGCLGYATEELMQTESGLQTIIFNAMQEEIAFQVTDAVICGNGTSRAQGIMSSTSLITVDAVTQTKPVVIENILDMYARLIPTTSACWIINQELIPYLASLRWADGVPALVPSLNNSLSGLSILGYPVIFSESTSAAGTAGDIILADMSKYLIVDKGSVNLATSAHIRFNFDEQAFGAIFR